MLATMREPSMHFATVAATVCLYLSLLGGAGFAVASSAQDAQKPAPATAPTPAAAATTTPASTQAAAPPSGDAAAKHAKRTACLKEAKTKKLVGADKTIFLKGCIAAP
jgi:hypothetical protein